MKSKSPEIRLRNGVKVPLMGLGIYRKFWKFNFLLITCLILGTTHSGGYIHDTVMYAIQGTTLTISFKNTMENTHNF